MNEANLRTAPIKNAEAVPLACEMARAVAEQVAVLEKHWKLSRDEALARVHETDDRTIERIRTAPPTQLTFVDLYLLGRHSPELASQRWQEVLQAARHEFADRLPGRKHHRESVLVVMLAQSKILGLACGAGRRLATPQFRRAAADRYTRANAN